MDRDQELRQAVDGSGRSALALLPARLCEVAVERLSVQAAGVALISSTQSRSLLSAGGELAGQMEDLQFTLGEGPCLDAFNAGAPALEADLSNGGRSRWPMFSEAALDKGVHAVFAFPLQVGDARFGVLDLARYDPGMLQEQELADALTLAQIAAEAVLQIQAAAVDGEVADDLGGVGGGRIVVHQATGMVSAQAAITVADALARLRAHAFSHGCSLYDVANDVVARRTTFTP